MSVLDFTDLTACAQKVRKAGFWKFATEFHNGLPIERTVWIEDRTSTDCKYDRKRADPSCKAANCPRLVAA